MKTCFDQRRGKSELRSGLLGLIGFESSHFLASVLCSIAMMTLKRFNIGQLGINIFQNMDQGKSENSLKQDLTRVVQYTDP